MELGEEDFLAVTRDDIDSEFTEYSITQRNELWSFIESQKELLRVRPSLVKSIVNNIVYEKAANLQNVQDKP